MPRPANANANLHALAQSQQAELMGYEDRLQAELQQAYRTGVLPRLQREAGRLVAEIAAARASGERVSESWLHQAQRIQSLQAQVHQELEGYGEYVAERVTAMQGVAVALGEQYAHELMRAGLGGEEASSSRMPRHDFAALPRRSVEAMVGRTQSDGLPLARTLSKYPAEAAQAIKRELVVSVALRYSPKKTARVLQEQLGGSLGDYLTLARTEILNAHRSAALSTFSENSDVVEGWEWILGKSDACSFCVSKVNRILLNPYPPQSLEHERYRRSQPPQQRLMDMTNTHNK